MTLFRTSSACSARVAGRAFSGFAILTLLQTSSLQVQLPEYNRLKKVILVEK